MMVPIVLGAMLGALFVLGTGAWIQGGERRVLALGLVVALIYVGFVSRQSACGARSGGSLWVAGPRGLGCGAPS